GKPADADRLLPVAAAAVVRAGNTPKLQLALASAHADLMLQRGDYLAARPLFERAMQLHEQVYGVDDPDVARLLNLLAGLLQNLHEHDAAQRHIDRAIRILESGYGERNPHLAIALTTRGNVYAARGLIAEAEASYTRALAILEATVGPDSMRVAIPMMNLAGIRMLIGRDEEAQRLVERALAVTERVLGPAHPRVGRMLGTLGSVQAQRAQLKEGIATLLRAVAIQEAAGEITPLDETLIALAGAYTRAEDFEKAHAAIDRAMKILAAGADLQQLGKATATLGRLEFAEGRPQAEHTLARALDLFARSVGTDHPDYLRVQTQLRVMFPHTHPDPDAPPRIHP
ncbi:MAG: tetratricopeptide repeat protein, partial [Deltaproteobacteria bacterium]|nr:tetratricopeptide repeat protein [Deltaproteobacteria bacterium]